MRLPILSAVVRHVLTSLGLLQLIPSQSFFCTAAVERIRVARVPFVISVKESFLGIEIRPIIQILSIILMCLRFMTWPYLSFDR